MSHTTKTISVYQFLNTCFRCFHKIEYPLLPDQSYGQLIFQTSDGKDFYYVQLIGNNTFAFICHFIGKGAERKKSKIDPQKVLALLADKPGGKSLTLDSLCPNCGRRQRHFNDNKGTTQIEIEYATWNEFERLSEDEKINRLQKIIELHFTN